MLVDYDKRIMLFSLNHLLLTVMITLYNRKHMFRIVLRDEEKKRIKKM